jgi:Fic family protein
MCYDLRMSDLAEKKLSKAEIAELRQLRLEAMNLQAIEGNPLDAEDIAMFEMFEREGWTAEQRRAHINALARALADK